MNSQTTAKTTRQDHREVQILEALEMQLEALMQIHREILADADEHGLKQEWWDSLNQNVDDIEALQAMIEVEKAKLN